jgi:Cft2 family RNA processing exonuclease
MQVVFVGGASGVGASCLAVEVGGQWIIVDAGVRVDRKSDPLPDLALLEGKNVRAIFVTHAHADHIGALPLVHQAFPTAPIFASRATGLLMEVMLADALKIMNKRAVEEMEIPLYPGELMGSMLNQVRPLPVGEPVTLPQLPGVTIHASRAGHIAGAVSFRFSGVDGTLVVSGDISSTPQRTVLGALPPSGERCDLLVLESTYGARLHPNRQGEEQRLAQAVAESVARGGHTLIPCFGLGRGQELLLALQAAQEKGQIPEFPIYVDGLVRRVCSTYLLLPEALPPVLQRQIRKGYLPFTGRNVSFVRDERERERILAGPPACIVSSSGMLTGGPSVWYAQRLAGQTHASILITGYVDEESAGKKLLDLAEQKKNTLDLNGTTVEVRCHVAKYSLSAHADGGELAAYAAALKPRLIALVHGDKEARESLRGLLTETEVVLPENGSTLAPQITSSSLRKQAQVLPPLPVGIGLGRELTLNALSELWRALVQVRSLGIVTARELATMWFGLAGEAQTTQILQVLSEDGEQRYFIQNHALEEAYRVRGQAGEETHEELLQDLVGKVVLLRIAQGSTKPVLCQSIEQGLRIRVLHPLGVAFTRSRYPSSAVVEVLGVPPFPMHGSSFEMSEHLDDLLKASRSIRRRLSARMLARQCNEGTSYTLGDLCRLAGVSAIALEDRLAIAKILVNNPLIFVQQRTLMEGEGLALYTLASDWHEALETTEEGLRPDQSWLQEIIQRYLGDAPDLYRRSIDPDTGEIKLAFHFPALAQQRYAAEIEAIRKEANVRVTLQAQPHQGELVQAALNLLPSGLTAKATPSVFLDRQSIQVKCAGVTTSAAIVEAKEHFEAKTGWNLELDIPSAADKRSTGSSTATSHNGNLESMDQHRAILAAQSRLRDLPDFVKAGAMPHRKALQIRFHFPGVARVRYAELLATIEQETGWTIQIPEAVHQEALVAKAHAVLPAGVISTATPSVYLQRQVVQITCKGAASQEELQGAQQRFEEETGWHLLINGPIVPLAKS